MKSVYYTNSIYLQKDVSMYNIKNKTREYSYITYVTEP